MTIIGILIAWIGGASAMWLYLRFTKQLRTWGEHEKALREERYHPKNSNGLMGAVYKADTTDFRKFIKSYFKYQLDLLRKQERAVIKNDKSN